MGRRRCRRDGSQVVGAATALDGIAGGVDARDPVPVPEGVWRAVSDPAFVQCTCAWPVAAVGLSAALGGLRVLAIALGAAASQHSSAVGSAAVTTARALLPTLIPLAVSSQSRAVAAVGTRPVLR